MRKEQPCAEYPGAPAKEHDLDRLFSEIKDRVYIRGEDRALILPPNRVYSLNESAFRVLDYLQGGGRVEKILASIGRRERLERVRAAGDVKNLLLGICGLMEGQSNPEEMAAMGLGIECREFKKEFYTYPVLSEFAVTYRCNLRCRFCYLEDGSDGQPQLGTPEARKIIFKIKNEAKVPFISFTGGEPLLRKDIEALVAYAVKIGLKTNLISNGTLLSKKRVRQLKKAGLGSAQVSLESPDEEINDRLTGSPSFRLTVEGIRELSAAGIYVHTNTTINRENYRHMKRYPSFLKALGVKKFSANVIIPVGRAGEDSRLWMNYSELGALIEEIKAAAAAEGVEFVWYSPLPYCVYNPAAKQVGITSCAACHGLLSVNPGGEILPCSSYNRPLGNWLKNDFETLWFSEEALYFRKMRYLHRVCRDCDKREICAGACPLYWEKRGYHEIETTG